MLTDRHLRLDGVAGGTRFRLFPQMPDLEGFAEPETVLVSPRPGTIGAGPFDGAMRVVDPIDKPEPYAFPDMPPFQGAVFPPAVPNRDGHFDHIPLDSRQFLSAHMYGSVRFVLDIWESYFGKMVDWYDPRDGFLVELVPQVAWDNAHAGIGFIETGGRINRHGEYQPFALNFDVLAHEVGHTLLFSELGIPSSAGLTPQFLAFHESMSDMVALLSTLHFESITDDLIDRTGGNLYVLNFLNRIGELSDSEQIRVASNSAVMADLADLQLAPDGEWIDPTGQGRNGHHLAQPLTGAIFDSLIEIYQDGLAQRGLIAGGLDPRGWDREAVAGSLEGFQAASSNSLALHRPAFLDALNEARDIVGLALARTWRRLDPNNLSFADVAGTYLDAMAELGQGHNLEAFARDFLARGIDVPGINVPGINVGGGGRPVEDSPPPASAPYLVRWQWIQRRRRNLSDAQAGVPEGVDSYERVYRMFDHSFRLGM
ncbi:hypothetical protein HBA54_18860 [Pelagibius litoralis]|uniref:Peptidase M4 family protein n=1 Tax=Pelagibius litoralis TaxID=374515 RepID=A0A967K8V5_9PROT|nr:hypothetical protein [Pelagibius litoralis]NIA70663.1 hypothetical protein [Pelagibius litoralis]